MSTQAVNETQSPLIGKVVSFWDHSNRGQYLQFHGVVRSSFRGESRKDYGREILNIELLAISSNKMGQNHTDQYVSNVTVTYPENEK